MKAHKSRPRGPQVVRGSYFEKLCTSSYAFTVKLEQGFLTCKTAFIQKATGNGNATETVVPLSEQMGLNMFVHTEETRRKRQRNWQATRNLQLLQSRLAVNQLPVSRNFLPAYPSLPTPFYSRFSSSEEFLVVSMELYILAFQKDWLVVLFNCLHN